MGEFKVGDRVHYGLSTYDGYERVTGEILALDGDKAWLRFDDGHHGTCYQSVLTLIPDTITIEVSREDVENLVSATWRWQPFVNIAEAARKALEANRD